MSRRKPEKKIVLLEPTFSDILACQQKQFRPYLEVMILEGENVTHESLGTLLGILEITDESEDSSYVVNYILSVIKKEYFFKGKRGPIESFESALHKANLALSKLAQHENINWIGKFNALIAVIEKNNLHFSQAGKASALLLRNNILTDISEGMSEEKTPNPLKTFTSLSSGKMEEDDKLILATPEIFDIFSLEEIKKSALRFSSADFAQFLKTALGNELEKIAALVVDIHKKEAPEEKKVYSENKHYELNAFSQKAFIPQARPREEKTEILNELEEALEKETPEDKKHGHIYIKEEFEFQKERKFNENAAAFKDNISNYWGKINQVRSKEKIQKSLNGFKLLILKMEIGKNILKILSYFWQKIVWISKSAGQNTVVLLKSWQKKIKKEDSAKKIAMSDYFDQNDISNFGTVPERSVTVSGSNNYSANWKKILPSFSGIFNKIKTFDRKRQIYVLIVFILIFIIPIFIARRMNSLQNKAAVQVPPSQSLESITPDVSPENSSFIEAQNVSTVFSGENIQGIINLNDSLFAISNKSLVRISDQKSWVVPENFGEISTSTAMNDLNIILLSNQANRIISFSPTSQKFQDNSLILPDNSQIAATGTFMTYLYILDSKNNRIYRYPRAEGGFGEKTNWLKGTADLSSFENMFVTDSVYLWGKTSFAKFFRGKNENIALEGYSNLENIHSVYADENFIYVLDKNNGKVIKFDATGKMITKFSSDKIKTAENLAVSNDGKSFYLSSSNEIMSFVVQ